MGKEDQPGDPQDPVRLLQMRPCYLLGRLYHDEVAAMMEKCEAELGKDQPAAAQQGGAVADG